MKIQINTDHNIKGSEALSAWIIGEVESALDHVIDRTTRVEVHLADENGGKGGQDDKRCVMEARLEGWQPVAVRENAATLELAVQRASHRLAQMIESSVESLRDNRRHPAHSNLAGSIPAKNL